MFHSVVHVLPVATTNGWFASVDYFPTGLWLVFFSLSSASVELSWLLACFWGIQLSPFSFDSSFRSVLS